MNECTELLNSSHRKKDFCCGLELLDNYLHRQANQDVKRKITACFVCEEESGLLMGYYTLSNSSVSHELIPEQFRKVLPKAYSDIPTILLGRFAIDKRFQGKGLGSELLVDALRRCFRLSLDIGSYAVIVDPINSEAENFYLRYGFIVLPGSKKMFLPMKTIAGLFG